MSIYILVGLLIAGLLKEILPKNFISKHLGKNRFSSILKATILGIPMPVCSCSVVPLAKSLQKEGASNGAVSSFLISTPITGVDSILATYSLFGAFFAIYRVITSIIIAVIAGVLQNIFQKKENNFKNSITIIDSNNNSKKNFKFSQTIKFTSSSKNCSINFNLEKRDSFKIKRVFTYAFNTLFSDISKSLLFGLILGAIFATFLPKELIAQTGENPLLIYLLVLLVATPLYVCATSSLPIGASLFMAGVPIGAVFLFLSAGPATNSVTMSIVKSMFGKVGFIIYISTITVFSLIFGLILDRVTTDFEISKYLTYNSSTGALNYFATIIMFGLMFYYWRRK